MKIYILAECKPDGQFEGIRILSEEELIIKPEDITETNDDGTYYTEVANYENEKTEELYYLEYKIIDFGEGINPWEMGITIKP